MFIPLLLLGKNMKRSIHGVGQMVSTMVLNRKQSPGRPSVSLDRFKDSIDMQDVTVMDTKLKILEILQVSAQPISMNVNRTILAFCQLITLDYIINISGISGGMSGLAKPSLKA